MVTLATLYNDFKTLIKQNFYDKDETDDLLDEKQATLVSGTNIKTINNNSLLGSGNISISGSGIVDASLDTSSTNPVQNQAIATEINSLNNSITNNVNTIYTSTVNCNSNLKFKSTAQIRYRRVGRIVTLRLWGAQASPTSTGWINIASIPTGYKPIEDVIIAMQSVTNTHIIQARTSNTNTVQCYVSSSGTEWVGLTATWFTNDDYPSP